MPSISIIIPCYNQSQYLYHALESVFIQGLDDFEIIVINDGSTDVPLAFYEELTQDKRVILINQTNQGVAAARNAGLLKASKEYIAFLDADDIWLPGKIKQQLQAREYWHADMIFTHIERFISPEFINNDLQYYSIPNKITPGICSSTLLITQEAFAQAGTFNERLKVGEFTSWYLKARACAIKEYVLEPVLVRHRLHDQNTSCRNQISSLFMPHS